MLYGRRPVLEFLRTGGAAERIFVAQEAAPAGAVREIQKRAAAAAVPIRVVPREHIDRLTGGVNHQGIVAIVGRFRYAALEDILAREDPLLLLLDGVMDPHNLGSLLRSADGAGFDGVVIRSRRSVQVTPAVRRVSAGAAEVVPVARVVNLSQAVERAKQAGLWIVGLAEDAADDIWSSQALEPPLGLVLGAEDRGISAKIAERCDVRVRIPSRGRLGSLNVAVAGAIAMFEVARRRASSGA